MIDHWILEQPAASHFYDLFEINKLCLFVLYFSYNAVKVFCVTFSDVERIKDVLGVIT